MRARASSVRRAGARPSMRGARAVRIRVRVRVRVRVRRVPRVRVRRVPPAPPRPRARPPRALRPPLALRAQPQPAPRARPQPAPHGADAGVRCVANRAPGSRSTIGGSASCHHGAPPGARGAPRASGCRPWRRPWSPSSARMPPACSACAMRRIRRRRNPRDAVPHSSEPRWTCLPDPDASASTVPIRLPRVQRINRDNRATLTRARFTDRLQPWSRNDNGILRFR